MLMPSPPLPSGRSVFGSRILVLSMSALDGFFLLRQHHQYSQQQTENAVLFHLESPFSAQYVPLEPEPPPPEQLLLPPPLSLSEESFRLVLVVWV